MHASIYEATITPIRAVFPALDYIYYLALSMISFSQQNIQFWSGAILLFSAGTLIFASTNVHPHTGEEEQENLAMKKGAIKESVASAIGMGIPLILGSLGHGH